MKKLIILLAVLPLVLSSCLKDDKDAFGKTASERIREVQEGTEKALTGAANGWLMEYYPSATQEYGGIAIYMKFQNGTVTVTSKREAPARPPRVSTRTIRITVPRSISTLTIPTSISIRSRTPVSARPIRVWEATASSSS